MLAERGERLGVAMNGGMYHPDRRPVGLTVADGREISPLVTSAGPGNFGLLPNGVFCLSGGHARVIETRAFAEARPDCTLATQSGTVAGDRTARTASPVHPRIGLAEHPQRRRRPRQTVWW